MKTPTTLTIKEIIEEISHLIPPLWPLKTIIARNPLQGFESFDFEEGLIAGDQFFHSEFSSSSDVNTHLIKWCQVFLDDTQACIKMPNKKLGFYASWLKLAPYDKSLNPKGKNNWLKALSSNPEEAILYCLEKLNISQSEAKSYLKKSLSQLPGFAGYIKWRSMLDDSESSLLHPISIVEFIAVRLVITCAVEQENGFFKTSSAIEDSFFCELKNRESTYLKTLLDSIDLKENKPEKKAQVQIVFCIDVRSEPIRYQIEQIGRYETFGFAGFFGLPISICDYEKNETRACCPVLIKPIHTIKEQPNYRSESLVLRHQNGKKIFSFLKDLYHTLKYNLFTPFALVETIGIWCGLTMVLYSFIPKKALQFKNWIKKIIQPPIIKEFKIDIPFDQQVSYANSCLKMIGLTKNFSPLVILLGHGSVTENNPFASSLDCGACGGNHGGPNGKILATILNSKEIRASLKERGIFIPQDTLFIGAEHQTTTNTVLIDPTDVHSSSHHSIIHQFQLDFEKAKVAACFSKQEKENDGLNKSMDWSETRPEWGLARNASFIIGPRSLSKKTSLDGRSFLHSYNWKEDHDEKILETILTAPVIVAQWINTQYFFSTLDNQTFGSGSKITQNIVGKMGIMQGNGSDLMHGLPLQSVCHSDSTTYHELQRLQIICLAPIDRIHRIIQRQPHLKNLILNGWMILIGIDPETQKPHQLNKESKWDELSLSYLKKNELFPEIALTEVLI